MTGGRENGTVPCHFGCGRQLNPTDAGVWQAGHDWKRGNARALRVPHSAFACAHCINQRQRRPS